MGFPIIEGISPKLSGGRKIIRRNTGHGQRITFGIQLEQLFIGPYIGTVRGDKDGNIPDDLNAIIMGILAQLIPLLKENKLDELVITDGIGHGAHQAATQLVGEKFIFLRPFQPGNTIVCIL